MSKNKPLKNVISIGYGRQMFEERNSERNRMKICASETAQLNMIIFSKKSDGLSQTQVTERLILYPTNSANKITMIYDAFRIANKIIRSSNTEWVVTTQDSFEAGLVGVVLKKMNNIHLTVQEHADVFSTKYWRSESCLNRVRFFVGKRVLKQADTIRVVSTRIRNTLSKMNLKGNITQLPVAVDVQPFVQTRGTSQFCKNEEKETFTYLTVARFVSQKNFSLLLNSFFDAWQTCPRIRLLIVGKGPQGTSINDILNTQYRYLETKDRPVIIQDWSNNVPNLMHSADAYVLSSNYEGWARVLIEAMFAKLPMVTTDVGCVGEVIIDNEHALVVPLNDRAALSAALLQMVTNDTLYQRIKENLAALPSQSIPGTDFSRYGKQWVETLE